MVSSLMSNVGSDLICSVAPREKRRVLTVAVYVANISTIITWRIAKEGIQAKKLSNVFVTVKISSYKQIVTPFSPQPFSLYLVLCHVFYFPVNGFLHQ